MLLHRLPPERAFEPGQEHPLRQLIRQGAWLSDICAHVAEFSYSLQQLHLGLVPLAPAAQRPAECAVVVDVQGALGALALLLDVLDALLPPAEARLDL